MFKLPGVLLGESRLAIEPEASHLPLELIDEILQGIDLPGTRLLEIKQAIAEVVLNVMQREQSRGALQRLWLRVFAARLDDQTRSGWGFFVIEKSDRYAHAPDRDHFHTVELYLSAEGIANQ